MIDPTPNRFAEAQAEMRRRRQAREPKPKPAKPRPVPVVEREIRVWRAPEPLRKTDHRPGIRRRKLA